MGKASLPVGEGAEWILQANKIMSIATTQHYLNSFLQKNGLYGKEIDAVTSELAYAYILDVLWREQFPEPFLIQLEAISPRAERSQSSLSF
jgi:hypothetical protein